MKVLLIAPNPKTESGGIAQWTGHILNYYKEHSDSDLKLVHCCLEDSRTTYGSDSMLKRLLNALHNYIPICRMMKEELNNNDVDVVHICTSASLSFFLNMYMISFIKKYKVKVVMHYRFGRIPQLLLDNTWESRLFKKILNKSNCNIVIDKSSYDSLLRHGYRNVVLIPNPLSPVVPEIVRKSSVSRNNRKILFVGHVIKTKGVYELVRACKEIDNIELELIGYVAETIRHELLSLAGHECSQWIKMVGIKDYDYIIKSMMQAGVFVLPTYTEGFPNVILESMACACPIVTTPVGAIPEMLDIFGETPCGLCVEPRKVEPLKDAILYFLEDSKRAESYGLLAQERVNKLYSMDVIWPKLYNIWRDV